MTTKKDTEVAPPTPPACVDFNKLHDACKAGKDHDAALAAAIIKTDADALPADPEPSPFLTDAA